MCSEFVKQNLDFFGTDVFTKTMPAHNNVTKRNFIDGERRLCYFLCLIVGDGCPGYVSINEGTDRERLSGKT